MDPDRLGIGGWSYGGILTNYTIATDGRFKAAISGARSSNQISMYGTDQYIQQYEQELGPPWKSQDLWVKRSYPFFHADRIKTPTLFLCGEKDFNVPLIGSEQMYQALRSLGWRQSSSSIQASATASRPQAIGPIVCNGILRGTTGISSPARHPKRGGSRPRLCRPCCLCYPCCRCCLWLVLAAAELSGYN